MNPLHPNFVTGFSDAEGCFYIQIIKDSSYKTGYRVQAIFIIGLNIKDITLLKRIQSFFNAGNIYTQDNKVYYKLSSIKTLSILINHFEKYPLRTQKHADFLLFKLIVEIINRKEHLTPEGLQKIINLKASLNQGLSDTLKAAYPNITAIVRPLTIDQIIPSPY